MVESKTISSIDYHDVEGAMIESNKITNIKSATESVSCDKMIIREDAVRYTKPLIENAAMNGKLDVLEWGKVSGCFLKDILDKGTMARVAENGHLYFIK